MTGKFIDEWHAGISGALLAGMHDLPVLLEPFLLVFGLEEAVERFGDASRLNGNILAGESLVENCYARFCRIMRFSV